MAYIQVQVSSRFDGLLFLTKHVAVTSRTWVKNNVGVATIQAPYSHPRLSELAEYGNIIRIREKGVPEWIGQVVNRQWDGDNGVVTLSCKSAEWMLQKKLTGQGRIYGNEGGESAGAVAYSIFRNAAIENNTLPQLKAGFFKCDTPLWREYNYEDLFSALQKLAEDGNAHFWVDTGLRMHFQTRRGADKRGTAAGVLREGVQLTNVRVSDSVEEMVTAAIGLGEGSRLIDKPKYPIRLDGVPIFRAEVFNVKGAGSVDALISPTREHLIRNGQPKVMIDANLTKRNGSYGGIGIGDTVTVITKNPLLRTVNAEVVGLELGVDDTMRVLFEVIPTVKYGNFASWSIV